MFYEILFMNILYIDANFLVLFMLLVLSYFILLNLLFSGIYFQGRKKHNIFVHQRIEQRDEDF